MPDLIEAGDGVYEMDVRGYSCPYPEVFTRNAIDSLEPGDVLKITLDNRPSTETVPAAVEEVGNRVLGVESRGSREWVIEVESR
ncbi:MAG: hypothetical protein MAG715_01077 [Methanonatronarchaeales archaeon]|nr:hypothetical protein [Methanonatronarchaeales archaeon]